MISRGCIVAAFAALGLVLACGGQTEEDRSAGETGGESGSSGSAASGATPTSGAAGLIPAAGSGGTGGVTYGVDGQSCFGLSGTECRGESCCTSIVVPAGSFPMGRGTEACDGCVDGCPSGMACAASEQPEHIVNVSQFALDKYEVTVGRFRAFVRAYVGPPPAEAGAHPLIADSGWDSSWDSAMPSTARELESDLRCDPSYETWTDGIGENEAFPINCASWHAAFAFCAWDGGRLPTEAEWEKAAVGGSDNRLYPWGSTAPTAAHANHAGGAASPFVAVGSTPLGDGRWAHVDLAGSVFEWTLDWYADDRYAVTPAGCADCANLTAGEGRVKRGGGWFNHACLPRTACRSYNYPDHRYSVVGFRCARLAP